MAAVAGRRVGHQLLVAASGRPEAEVERGCATPSPGRCWWPAPPPRATGSATPCSRRPSTATCCRASGPACTPPTRGCWPRPTPRRRPSASAAELAWHCLASHDLPGGLAALVGRPTTPPPCSPQRGLPPPHPGWSCGAGCRTPPPWPASTGSRCWSAAEAASDSGEFRQAVGLAEEAVATNRRRRAAAGGHGLRAPQQLPARRRAGAGPDHGADAATSRRAVELVPSSRRPRCGPGSPPAGPLADGRPRLRGSEALGRHRPGWPGPPAASATRPGRWSSSPPRAALRRRGHGPPDAARRRPGGRRRRQPAAGAGGPPRPGLFELDLGNLAAACTALDQATELAERSGLAWSGYGIDSRVLRRIAHYSAGAGTRPSAWPGGRRARPAVSAAACTSRSAGAAPPRSSGWPASSRTGRPTPMSPTWPAAARPTWSAGRATWNAPASWPARPSRPRRRRARPGC